MALKYMTSGIVTTSAATTAVKELLAKIGVEVSGAVGSGIATFTVTSSGIYDMPDKFELSYGSMNSSNIKSVVIFYNEETKFISIMNEGHLFSTNINSRYIYGTINKDKIKYSTIHNDFNVTNINLLNSGEYTIMPLYALKSDNTGSFIPDIYICMNSSNNAGNIITDGTNRFVCIGTIFYKKITPEDGI